MVNSETVGGLSPFRLRRLIQKTIKSLELDLTGGRVLTEAASVVYASTAVIAAAAGAEVYALTANSPYGTIPEVLQQVTTMADSVGAGRDRIHILTDRSSVPRGLNIITNLGFVRPVDVDLLERLAPDGAVSYMCEAWEVREGDVDLAACDRMGVPVAGVWEDFDQLNVFRSCGQLAVKMCFEAGLEVAGNRLIVISGDKFGPTIALALEANLASVSSISSASDLSESLVAEADAIIVADYSTGAAILGGGAGPSIADLKRWNPELTVIQFAGVNDVALLREAEVRVFPDQQLQPHRMAFTLAHLGVRPTILLHTAGLKVGELLWRARSSGTIDPRFRELIQPMNEMSKALAA